MPRPPAKSTSRGASSTKRVAGQRPVTSTHRAAFTAPGLSAADGARVADALQGRLNSMLDLSMTLKHIHWNVVGPAFIGVHTMLDPQYAGVSRMTDALAERIATLGGVPNGLPVRSSRRATGTTTSSAEPTPRPTSAPSTSCTPA